MTPSELYGLKPYKKIIAQIPNSETCSSHFVIAENDFTYVVDEWYKEEKKIPQLVPKMFVIQEIL